ncbi:hypothetical protein FQN60_017944, partial [Etheostoma spectabile]
PNQRNCNFLYNLFLSIFRNVLLAKVLNGKLETTEICFSEFEARVATITSKAKEAVGQQESFVLTDSQGNEIMMELEGRHIGSKNPGKHLMELLQFNERKRLR